MSHNPNSNNANNPTPREIIDAFNQQLDESGTAPGLLVGEKAPDFTLQNQDGNLISLSDKLLSGQVILSFYRGEWCSHCNREMQQIKEIQDKLDEQNVTVLAIAPQHIEYASTMAKKNEVTFDLLSDPDLSVIDNYKLKFTMSEDVQNVYKNNFNLNLPNITANNTWELPIPGTFVINQNGIITGRFVDTDYRKRLTGEELLRLLKS